MATRSVFISKDYYPYFEEIQVNFDWFPGFALSQKRKSQISLHQNFLHAYPDEKVLEISSASLYSLGSALSAMHLHKRTAFGVTTVESAFQSSRIYDLGNKEIGPFHEYLAAAIFISLVHNGLINEVRQYDSYLRLFRTKKDGSPINDSAFDRVQLLDKNEHLMLLSPVVPCVFSREKTQAYYEENCSGLSNKQTPENFLDLICKNS